MEKKPEVRLEDLTETPRDLTPEQAEAARGGFFLDAIRAQFAARTTRAADEEFTNEDG